MPYMDAMGIFIYVYILYNYYVSKVVRTESLKIHNTSLASIIPNK